VCMGVVGSVAGGECGSCCGGKRRVSSQNMPTIRPKIGNGARMARTEGNIGRLGWVM